MIPIQVKFPYEKIKNILIIKVKLMLFHLTKVNTIG